MQIPTFDNEHLHLLKTGVLFCSNLCCWLKQVVKSKWKEFSFFKRSILNICFISFYSVSLATETSVSFFLVIMVKESSFFKNNKSYFCDLGSY